jgi:hypothetical protein
VSICRKNFRAPISIKEIYRYMLVTSRSANIKILPKIADLPKKVTFKSVLSAV